MIDPSRIELEVSGTDLATLVASTFALDNWPFSNATALSIATPDSRARASLVAPELFAQAREIWRREGAWHSTDRFWTRELIKKRAAVAGTVSLSRSQASTLVESLLACAAEFSDHWNEFCTVTPGNLDWYGVEPSDLPILAKKLEAQL